MNKYIVMIRYYTRPGLELFAFDELGDALELFKKAFEVDEWVEAAKIVVANIDIHGVIHDWKFHYE